MQRRETNHTKPRAYPKVLNLLLTPYILGLAPPQRTVRIASELQSHNGTLALMRLMHKQV